MSDPVYAARCFYCGNDIDPLGRDTWRRIIGWEKKAGIRASGKHGGSDIALREPRDQYAHHLCVRRMQQGVNASQGTLL